MKNLSRDAHNLYGQPMFKLLAKINELEAQGKRILHFEMGDPQFPSPEAVVEAAYNAMRAGKTHYVNSMGISELRDAICDYAEERLGFSPTREQVLITPANAVIYFLIRCVVNSGEEVIYPDPGFPTYHSAISFTGAKGIPVQLREGNQFRMLPGDIRDAITSRTKLIIVNSPNNPTGSVMTKEEIEEAAKIAKESDVYLLSDEVYDKITYDVPHYSPSIRDRCRERTILLNSLSKTYSMTGWRLGYAIGPEDVIEKMGLLLQTTISCVPPFIQHAGIIALTEGQMYVDIMVDTLRHLRNAMVNGLNSLPGVSCLTPDGAFYAFPSIAKTGFTSQQFADLMLEEAGVALLPGTNFGKYGEGYVRLSYATHIQTIGKAIERMKKALK